MSTYINGRVCEVQTYNLQSVVPVTLCVRARGNNTIIAIERSRIVIRLNYGAAVH